jgi:hypothetical protein
MFLNAPGRAEQARQQAEAAPLEVKIHYLAEFMAADHGTALASMSVPLLALRPGFTPEFLADPANSFYKLSFLDTWERFVGDPRIEVKTVPNARALILDDQPEAADAAIAAFVEKLSPAVPEKRSKNWPRGDH